MSHPFMAGVANGLAERGIATLRYQFPYIEKGRSDQTRPSSPKRLSALLWSKRPVLSRSLLWSQGANHMAAA